MFHSKAVIIHILSNKIKMTNVFKETPLFIYFQWNKISNAFKGTHNYMYFQVNDKYLFTFKGTQYSYKFKQNKNYSYTFMGIHYSYTCISNETIITHALQREPLFIYMNFEVKQ